jgi:hypothetical protein
MIKKSGYNGNEICDKYAFGCLESGVVPRFCSGNCQRCNILCDLGMQRHKEHSETVRNKVNR